MDDISSFSTLEPRSESGRACLICASNVSYIHNLDLTVLHVPGLSYMTSIWTWLSYMYLDCLAYPESGLDCLTYAWTIVYDQQLDLTVLHMHLTVLHMCGIWNGLSCICLDCLISGLECHLHALTVLYAQNLVLTVLYVPLTSHMSRIWTWLSYIYLDCLTCPESRRDCLIYAAPAWRDGKGSARAEDAQKTPTQSHATQECRAEWPTGEIAKFGYFISS